MIFIDSVVGVQYLHNLRNGLYENSIIAKDLQTVDATFNIEPMQIILSHYQNVLAIEYHSTHKMPKSA